MRLKPFHLAIGSVVALGGLAWFMSRRSGATAPSAPVWSAAPHGTLTTQPSVTTTRTIDDLIDLVGPISPSDWVVRAGQISVTPIPTVQDYNLVRAKLWLLREVMDIEGYRHDRAGVYDTDAGSIKLVNTVNGLRVG